MLSAQTVAEKKGWSWDPNPDNRESSSKLLSRAKTPRTQPGCAPGSIQDALSARIEPSSAQP